jgi:predicted NAD/FAD-binding protein
MNSLQGVSPTTNYFVSLNAGHIVDPAKVKTYISYQHPVFDLCALRAQQVLPELNLQSLRSQVFFCGSYFGYGFHEDALSSSYNLAGILQGAAICH